MYRSCGEDVKIAAPVNKMFRELRGLGTALKQTRQSSTEWMSNVTGLSQTMRCISHPEEKKQCINVLLISIHWKIHRADVGENSCLDGIYTPHHNKYVRNLYIIYRNINLNNYNS